MVKTSTSNSSLDRVISEQQFNEARAKTAVLYKLTKVMLRLGSFDHLFKLQMAGMNVIHTVSAKDINYSNPTGKDAEKVVKLGLNNASAPNLSGYYEGQWVHYTPEMRLQLYKDTVLTNGISLVRHSIYY